MNGNGQGPMNKGQQTGRQLGYCSGYKNAGFKNTEFGNSNGRRQNTGFGNGRRFVEGFRDDIEYTQKELLSLRKFKLQKELELIEEKLKNL